MNQSTLDRRANSVARGLAALGLLTLAGMWPLMAQGQSPELNARLTSKDCMTCHAWDMKLVGPSFRNVRARYNPADIPRLVQKLLNGGAGAWGAVPEIRHRDKLSAEEAELLIAGVLGVGALGRPAVSAPLPAAASLPDDPVSVGGMASLR